MMTRRYESDPLMRSPVPQPLGELFQGAATDCGRPTARQSTRRATSDEAYESSELSANRAKIATLIMECPRTCDEIVSMGYAHQSASASINWLMRRGLIVPTGETRTTRMGRRAIVWRHEPNPHPISTLRPTRSELERRISAALFHIGDTDETLYAILTGEVQR
jgi:hypothetical protein